MRGDEEFWVLVIIAGSLAAFLIFLAWQVPHKRSAFDEKFVKHIEQELKP